MATDEFGLALIENKALTRIQIDVFTPSMMHHRPQQRFDKVASAVNRSRKGGPRGTVFVSDGSYTLRLATRKTRMTASRVSHCHAVISRPFHPLPSTFSQIHFLYFSVRDP